MSLCPRGAWGVTRTRVAGKTVIPSGDWVAGMCVSGVVREMSLWGDRMGGSWGGDSLYVCAGGSRLHLNCW